MQILRPRRLRTKWPGTSGATPDISSQPKARSASYLKICAANRTTPRSQNPTHVTMRFNGALKAKAEALAALGKPAKVAIIAIKRMTFVLANALLNDGRKWRVKPT